MDKTKYNRAAKDASQLQQFVDEACDAIGGSQDSLHITVKDTDGNEAATFDVAYDNGDDLSYVKFDSRRDGGVVTFDSCGNATFRYVSNYMTFVPETSTLYVGNADKESIYHFMPENEDDSERNGNVMIAQNAPKEWVLGEQEDQLTLDSCQYQVTKIDMTNLKTQSFVMSFPTMTLAVDWNNPIDAKVNAFSKNETSHRFVLELLPSIVELGYLVVDLTNPLIAHVYGFVEV